MSIDKNNKLLPFIIYTIDQSPIRTYFGKIIVQKIVYFIQNLIPEIGINYNYRLHYFGPYSDMLERELTELEFEDIIDVEQRVGGMGYQIKVKQSDTDFKDAINSELQEKIRNAVSLFDNDGPAGLELKSTFYYLWLNVFNKKDPLIIKDELMKQAKIVKPNFTAQSFDNCFDWLVSRHIIKT
jgi:uncharacterized protein